MTKFEQLVAYIAVTIREQREQDRTGLHPSDVNIAIVKEALDLAEAMSFVLYDTQPLIEKE